MSNTPDQQESPTTGTVWYPESQAKNLEFVTTIKKVTVTRGGKLQIALESLELDHEAVAKVQNILDVMDESIVIRIQPAQGSLFDA